MSKTKGTMPAPRAANQPDCGMTHAEHIAAWRTWRDDCSACGFALRDLDQCRRGHPDDGVTSCGNCGHEADPAVTGALSPPADVPLTDLEYTVGIDLVTNAVRILRVAPVARLLATLSPIEALAPVLEPTAFARGGARNLDHQRRLLKAVAEVLRVADDIERECGS